ncbi:hypothetical protein Godav_010580 [Gossypium davidsonii]|uniref:Uncharacterized protein n=1 Tax=Gossypium davidsonii TaxID=34287 RepID=A0A7J8SGX7_GOSDV|nr:hypothetical protein [Gossypium davidsonii]
MQCGFINFKSQEVYLLRGSEQTQWRRGGACSSKD